MQQIITRIQTGSPVRIVLDAVAVLFGIKVVVMVVLGIVTTAVDYVAHTNTTEALMPIDNIDLTFGGLVTAVIVAPFLETVISMVVPIWIASRFTRSFPILLSIVTVCFALPHIDPGLILAVGIPGGLVFGTLYLARKEISFEQAFWMTIGAHALHNAISMVLYITLSV